MVLIASALGLFTLTTALTRDQSQVPLSAPSAKSSQSQPNIIFFLTDDQDVHLDSLAYQPAVHRHLINEGLTFKHHFCTIAICCPSRVNLWTGKAAHNTNVTDIAPPYGGYPKFVSQGLNSQYLPVWLQEAGYRTYYTGKLFNAHTVENYNEPFPAAWTGSDFLLDPNTYSYLNSSWQRDTDPPVSHEGDYVTDVLSQKAKGFLQDAVETKDPFFLAIAPVAPHSNIKVLDGSTLLTPETPTIVTPPVAAERHKDLFKNVQIPRTEHFNPDKASGVSWIRQLPKLSSTQVEYNDEFYRSRLRSLQAVDELVDDIFGLLEQHGILNNTYVIYSSDNGYHIGQHRLPPGKECGYEEDVNVPLIVRGPNVPKGITTDQVTSHTDLVPTILGLIGAQPRDDLDGTAIPLREDEISLSDGGRHEHVNLEFWGFALAEGKYGFSEDPSDHLKRNNTYKAIRVISPEFNLYYSVWCTNEHELYDLTTDPYQLNNIHPSAQPGEAGTGITALPTVNGHPLAKVISRLDALLLVLKSCKGSSCVKPWQVLHPGGDVNSLADALNAWFDYYYEKMQVKVEFSRCEQGQLLDAEGPQEALVYRDGLYWNEWT